MTEIPQKPMSTYYLWMIQKCCICIIICALYNLSLVTLEVNNTRQQYSGYKLYNNIMYSKFLLLISSFEYLQITCSMQYHNFTKYLAFNAQDSFCHCLRSVVFQCYMCYILHAYYFMVADIYIFVLFLSFFFPRLISAVGDWMSIILPHMVWP